MNGKTFWQFRNSAQDPAEAELLLYGDISEYSWWGDTVSPKKFNEDLRRLGNVRSLTVRINSYGGDVFAAHAIYNSLVQHPAVVRVRIDGIAASAATIVMLAGNEIVMPENAMIMVHNPWTIAMGDARDLRKQADTLDQVRESMLAVYETRTGMKRQDLVDMMDSETWMTAEEAAAHGFADTVEKNERVPVSMANGKLVVNGLVMDASRMRMAPMALIAGGLSVTGEEVKNVAEPIKNDAPAAPAEPVVEEPVVAPEPIVTPDPVAEPEAVVTAGTLRPGETIVMDGQVIAAGIVDPIQAAVVAERKRIADINALARPGAEKIIAAAVESGADARDVAMEILKSPEVTNAATLAARRADAPKVPTAGVDDEDPKAGRVGLLVRAMRKRRGLADASTGSA